MLLLFSLSCFIVLPHYPAAWCRAISARATGGQGAANGPAAGEGAGGDVFGFIGELIGGEPLITELVGLVSRVRGEVLTANNALEITLIVGAIVPAILFGPRLRMIISTQLTKRAPTGLLRRAANALATIATPLALYLTWRACALLMAGAAQLFGGKDKEHGEGENFIALLFSDTHFLKAASSLLTAWILIRLVTLVIRSDFWSKVAFYTVWPLAVLNAFGLLDSLIESLRAVSITLSPETATTPALVITALDVIRAGIVFALFLWVAGALGDFLVRRIEKVEELNPSLKAMLAKIINLVLPVVALLLALQFVGFNLASLAIFGGAVGIGIGLGLQRVVSNFAAGITLLADKSIKPGDVIRINDTFGWVSAMNTRYVALKTRDGEEHLVPNDMFMNEGVVNWSHSDAAIRLKIRVGVAYETEDLDQVVAICQRAAAAQLRVLPDPPPLCHLLEFGDSAILFELRFWIRDPREGVTNIKSEIQLGIWREFRSQNIRIPFPQHDIHLRAEAPFRTGEAEG